MLSEEVVTPGLSDSDNSTIEDSNEEIDEDEDEDDLAIGDLDAEATDGDVEHAIRSGRLTSKTQRCTFQMIQHQMKSRPQNPAVEAWDGTLTYSELYSYAHKLAGRLRELNVYPETIVTLLFHKSVWAVVSMVAVQLSGAAFVCLDPDAPLERLQTIFKATKSPLVLTSTNPPETLRDLDIDSCLNIDRQVLDGYSEPGRPLECAAKPENASFIIFTSGSTGKPKGIIVDHQAICSSADAYGMDLGIGPGSRVFQFSAYTFDVGILDVLVTIVRGGCVCVPSEYDRINNLSGSIRDSGANWAFLTPTVAHLLSPAKVPNLKVLCLGGEAINQKVVDKWKDECELHGLYGPAESSIVAWNPFLGKNGNSVNIGRPLASNFWVVQDSNQLTPIGAVGELVIEGPLLARGYLNAEEEVAANFIEDAKWLPGESSEPRRVYRTGDLVCRNSDGTFDFKGRKDSQVKINGQRIELGEIESCFLETLPEHMNGGVVTVDNAILAFMWPTESTTVTESLQLIANVTSSDRELIFQTKTKMTNFLPAYMIPNSFFVCTGKPRQTQNGKIDRTQIINLGKSATFEDRARFSTAEENDEDPSTAMELKIRVLWAVTLDIDPQRIKKNSSFLGLGGDSIAAIHLVTEAEEQGIQLNVASIFEDPRLCSVSEAATPLNEKADAHVSETKPFELLEPNEIDSAEKAAVQYCNLNPESQSIRDMYPCTPLQEGLMALSSRNGSYIANNVFLIPKRVDVSQLKEAWESTVSRSENMRTRVVKFGSSTIQVLIEDRVFWENTDQQDLETYLQHALHREMTYGTALSRQAIVRDSNGDCFLVWTAHHAIFDGWSMILLMEALNHAYEGSLPSYPRTSYASFVKYVKDIDKEAATAYWKHQLQDAERANFPERAIHKQQDEELASSRIIKHAIDFTAIRPELEVTQATVLRAAWAILLARYCNSDDITFGTTVSGRNAPLQGLSHLSGPAVATVPVRVKLKSHQTLEEFLRSIQQQGNDMVPYEQWGLQNISRVSSAAKEACDFSTLMVIQPASRETTDDEGVLTGIEGREELQERAMQGYFSYPLVASIALHSGSAELTWTYRTRVFDEPRINALSKQLEHIVRQLLSEAARKVGDISVSGPWDIETATEWNNFGAGRHVSSSIPEYVHRQALQSPEKEAIWSRNKIITYHELEVMSTDLAHHLLDVGVQRGTYIPICSEKTIWPIIAMLAIHKAGAAFVPIDPSYPKARIATIISNTNATHLIASPDAAETCKDLDLHKIILGEDLFKGSNKTKPSKDDTAVWNLGWPDLKDAAYVVFSSGSTGTPKGIIVEHMSVMQSVLSAGAILGLSSSSRMLHFTSLSFDMSFFEILAPLFHGGTVCVPDEAERLSSISSFICDSITDVAFFPPSFAKTLHPNDVPGLRKLLIGGESPGEEVVRRWKDSLALFNVYGPAECTILTTWYRYPPGNYNPRTIGRPIARPHWIVDLEHPSRLSPVGCVGELAIQGDILARGYLNAPTKTKESFITVPAFEKEDSNRQVRIYRTGDIVKQNMDGTIDYIGRKDTQVKIRGQRLEVAEVEHHMVKRMSKAAQVVVEAITMDDRQSLVAFLHYPESEGKVAPGSHEYLFKPSEWHAYQNSLSSAVKGLKSVLPPYMIPDMFLPVHTLPYQTASMKLNRKLLREMAQGLSPDELATYTLSNRVYVEPTSELELRLRDIWAQVLRMNAKEIGKRDAFLEIGGDSISAIQLVSQAEKAGITLVVADIFEDSRLDKLAKNASAAVSKDTACCKPFSMVTPKEQLEATLAEARRQCNLSDSEVIEDMYPCAALAEGLMALSRTNPRSYIMKMVYRLPRNVDLSRFRDAWTRTMESCSNMRTRIVSYNGKAMQVVISDTSLWDSTDSEMIEIDSYLQSTKNMEMGYGTPLNNYGLATSRSNKDATFFVWNIHHAVLDGWSLNLAIGVLKQAYDGQVLSPLPPYSGFISYVHEIDASEATKYWQSELSQAKSAEWPPSSSSHKKNTRSITKTMSRKIKLIPSGVEKSITKATILRGGWAIVLSKYCDSSDITFGTTVSGRNASVPGLTEMPGPAIATVPVRVKFQDDKMLTSVYLRQIQEQSSRMVPFEQFGLSKISNISKDAKSATQFTSLFVIQPKMESSTPSPDDLLQPSELGDSIQEELIQGYFTYPLVVQCHIAEDHIEMAVTYDIDILSESQLHALSHHFETVVQQLTTASDLLMAEVKTSGNWDIERATEFNNAQDTPEIIESCLHELIASQAETFPDRLAIDSWDARLTYSELDSAANSLSQHLIQEYAVQSGDMVHVLFEKSAWYYVAILAINKAGAAWVPLDPEHPVQRLRHLVTQTKAKVALTSHLHSSQVKDIGIPKHVLEVTPELIAELPAADSPMVHVGPQDAAYVLFTSGSTGNPKGFVMEHGSVATSQTAIGKRLGVTPEIRILQFASFVFDLSIGEIIMPLIHGACVCVPSEHTRINGLGDFVQNKDINWIFMTPSLLRTFKPSDLPTVKLVLLAGEAVGQDILDTWLGEVRLINGWGPAETCVFSTLHEWPQTAAEASPMTVGKPVGGHCWIVDSNNPRQLAPIGTLGEIVIQGPTLLREYLNNPSLTNESLITEELPTWATPNSQTKSWARIYQSGDVGYYNEKGDIEFSSRKDTQVKIRGLRVELGEVEHHMRLCMPDLRQVVVEVFDTDRATHLVAFMCFNNSTRRQRPEGDLFEPLEGELSKVLTHVIGELGLSLPNYMVPTMFIKCNYMPTVTSTKIDRKLLKHEASHLDDAALAAYSLQDSQKQPPQTDMEHSIQSLWSELLGISKGAIGRDDSFLRLGGDSIAAIKLVSMAQNEGVTLFVKDIMQDPRLKAVAARAEENHQPKSRALWSVNTTAPFSLLSDPQRNSVLHDRLVHHQCRLVEDEQLADVYPCSAMQQGLMSLSEKQPGSYITKYILKISPEIDQENFRDAWDRTVEMCSNMRTRIIKDDHAILQAVIKGDRTWDDTDGHTLKSYVDSLSELEMTYGSRLCRFALIDNDKSAESWFVWSIHHAVTDGYTLRLVHQTLHANYWGLATPNLQPYSRFIQHITAANVDKTIEYWAKQMDGAHRQQFPPKKSGSIDTRTDLSKRRVEFGSLAKGLGVTKATLLRAAWAVLLAKHSSTSDITFGATSSGRSAAIDGLDCMPGPVIATIPVRIQIDENEPVFTFLQRVQSQAIEVVDHEQFGLQNLSKLSPDAKNACDFTSLLVVQPADHFSYSDGGADGSLFTLPETAKDSEDMEKHTWQNYFNYPLVLLAGMLEGSVDFNFYYDRGVLDAAQVDALSHQLEHVLHQLISHAADDNISMDDISLIGPKDISHAVESNRLRVGAETNVSAAILTQMNSQADATAISSWDAELSYAELQSYTTCLARRLKQLGVGPEVIVPICFSKSVWAVVAMVAVQMAGGAFAPLDPSAPIARLERIFHDINGSLVIAATEFEDKIKGLGEKALFIGEETFPQLLEANSESIGTDCVEDIDPEHPALVIFTSGSTGLPKGMVIEHRAIATLIDTYGANQRIGPGSRVFNFSAFTFDLGIYDILVTLARGGCVIIPSEQDRMNNLADAINRTEANYIVLTPTVAGLLNPEGIPSLEQLCLGGEAISKPILDRWQPFVEVSGIYGPAEANNCALNHDLTPEQPTCLGWPMASAFWVTEPDNPKKLVPIGCIGELIIQGPMLARGYCNVPENIDSSWLRDVDWFPDTGFDLSRAYRSGDLVRRNADGTFTYIGRKDTQVKIHGRRLELGEIESQLKTHLPKEMNGIVDLITYDDEDKEQQKQLIVALLWVSGSKLSMHPEEGNNQVVDKIDGRLSEVIAHVDSCLAMILPAYMIPSTYLIFAEEPERSASGKINRQQLALLARQVPAEDRQRFAPGSIEGAPPTTPMEQCLAQLWAKVLSVSQSSVYRTSNFLRLGGDSLSAIQLVKLARDENVSITVADIFKDPRLCAISQAAEGGTQTEFTTDPTPFSLLAPEEVDEVVTEIEEKCNLGEDRVLEDAYPLTSLQEGYITGTIKVPGAFISRRIYTLPKEVNLERFKKSWEKLLDICGVLRSRIIHYRGNKTIQARIQNEYNWEDTEGHSLSSFMDTAHEMEMGYDGPLNRFGIVKDEDRDANYFVWVIQHALFDGYSMGLIISLLGEIYDGGLEHLERLSIPTPFTRFVGYTESLDRKLSAQYWTEKLNGVSGLGFPKRISPQPDQPRRRDITRVASGTIEFPQSVHKGITAATIIRTAFGIMLSYNNDSTSDITFSMTLSGRQAGVKDMEKIIGPAISRVPVRLQLDADQSVHQLLEKVQNEAAEMSVHEQYGPQNISKLGSGPAAACDASSLLIIQPAQLLSGGSDSNVLLMEDQSDVYSVEKGLDGFYTYPFVVHAVVGVEDKMSLTFVYDRHSVTEEQVTAMKGQMEHVTKVLSTTSNETVGDVLF